MPAVAAAVLMAQYIVAQRASILTKQVQVAHCQHNNHECKTVHVHQTYE